jgi:hypothetical protein
MSYHRATAILFLVTAISLFISPSHVRAQREESYEGFINGLRANAVKGQVAYHRKDGKFDLEPGLKLEEGDFIKTGTDSYAELLLHPGNYLRIGGDSDFQIFTEAHDKMRLKLNQGTINLEILAREDGSFTSFYYTRAQLYELIRVITPNAEVFVTQTGIYRINHIPGGRTELIVRDGEALINGLRVKKKRRAVISGAGVSITEYDTKAEDPFEQWGRERAKTLIEANRVLKNESPWARKRKEGFETTIDLPEDEEQQQSTESLYVVSAKPGTISFVETGVEFSTPENDWQQLSEKSELKTGDKLRTNDHSFVELTVLPDMHLRLNGNTEVSFEELSNESISIKLLRGSAILDIARFDRKQVPQIRLTGPTISAVVSDEGNYRFDSRAIIVRDGKVIWKERSIGSCRRITIESVSDCEKHNDSFDFWSEHRGEGRLYDGNYYTSMVAYLARLRRARFRNSGFWFQNPGQTHYTFVPFTSTFFRSPYGGNYSTVLTPRRRPMHRIDMSGNGGRTFGRFPRPQIARP